MNELSSKDISFTSKLDELILENLENENFGVKELVHLMGMSRFNLNRKLHFIFRKTINQYIREIRLQRAMEILQQEQVTASEVAYKVGFSSPAYFSTCFSEYFGYPPGEARKRGIISTGDNQEVLNKDPIVIEKDPGQSRITPLKWEKHGRWAITVVAFLILFMISLFFYFNFINHNWIKNPEKSIAVLPFINDSQDADNEYFINGVMEAILDNLSKIKDLEVHPRTSVEQYRNNKTKTIPQIARELGVNYIIEGSGQKIGNQVSLYIQLIEAGSDKHLFSDKYNMKFEDIFDLQSDVAIKVANEIKAAITIDEKELIEKPPTANFDALNLFLQANDLHNIAKSEAIWELDVKAERLYRKAILLDSTYADPYVPLGWIILDRNIDSSLYLANKALHFDDTNPEAYLLKGSVLYKKGMEIEAEEAYKQSIIYKPNNSAAFRSLGELYFYQGNCYGAMKNQLQAFRLENNSLQERNNLESFCSNLYSLGFYDTGEKYASKLLELSNDSTFYYWGLVTADLDLGNNESALKTSRKIYMLDTNNLDNIYALFYTHLYLRNFKEAYQLLQKYTGIMKLQGKKIEPDYLFGFIYLENGKMKEADFHFDETIKETLKIIELNQPSVTCIAYMTLAKIYSVRDEKEKALECLHLVTDCMGSALFRIKDFKYCTMFDNIRQEPAFAEYIKEVENRYTIEHDKVEKLLRKEGIITSSI